MCKVVKHSKALPIMVKNSINQISTKNMSLIFEGSKLLFYFIIDIHSLLVRWPCKIFLNMRLGLGILLCFCDCADLSTRRQV